MIKDNGNKKSGASKKTSDLLPKKRPANTNNYSYIPITENAELKRIFDSSPIFIFIKDINGKFLYVNRTYAEGLQVHISSIIGKTVFDVFPNESAQEMTNDDRDVISTRKPKLKIIKGYETPRGFRWLQTDIIPVFDGSGTLTGLIGFVIDITEQKLAEEALKASELRFKRIVECIADDVYSVDFIADQLPVITSHGLGRMRITGYTPDEFAADPDLNMQLIYEDDRTSFWSQMMKILAGEEVPPFEYRIKNKNGTLIWVRNTPVLRFENGKLIGYDSLVSDITLRKEAEEALRISEEKYRDFFESAVEGIYQSTLDGDIVNANPSFAKMLGYESSAQLITGIKDIKKQLYINPEECEYFTDLLLNSGSVIDFEHRLRKKDGSVIWVSTSGRIVRDKDGNITYYEGSCIDISGRKKAEEDRESLQSQLSQAKKMEAIGTFIGGVAHDFNNILSVVMGYTSLLQMELNNDHNLRSYVDELSSSAKKAASLIHNLLAFSRKQTVTLKPLKLNELIRNTENFLKRLLTEDISLVTDLHPDEITIMGDHGQIDQILLNLATNARDAMPKGGTLNIGTRLVDGDDPAYKNLAGKGPHVLITVSDTGIGFDAETREHIFDPFFTTKDVDKGTGLGLSTVYGIVRQHKGEIDVSSEPGKGTTFRIFIPAVTDKVKRDAQQSPHLSAGKEKILVAEDNESVRLLIKKILSKYGYGIIEAVDGEDALEKYNENQDVDMLILDSVMPRKNGREVYDYIIKRNPDIKVLFTSGYTRDIVLDKGIEEKEVDFIPKPLTPDALLEKVREVLDK